MSAAEKRLCPADVAEILSCSIRTACAAMRKAGAYKFGESWRLPQERFEEWVALQEDPLALDRRRARRIFKMVEGYVCRPGRLRLETELSWVYFVQSGATPYIKIGVTNNIAKRLDSMQTGNPELLRTLAMVHGDEGLEKALHDEFRADMVRGEWFHLTPTMRLLVEIIDTEGQE